VHAVRRSVGRARAVALGALVSFLLLALPAAGPSWAQAAESIRRYDVAIRILDDGSVRFTETIEYDFGSTDHHGIFRDIPTRLHVDDTYDRIYPLDVESVSATGGASADHQTEDAGNGKTRIRIGDADETVTGRHTYTIVYVVRGALNGFADHDELYWNAIGDDWAVPIARASATVAAPEAITRIACYRGYVGSTEPCRSAQIDGSGAAAFAERDLLPYEAMTVVAALPKGAVPQPRPILEERWTLGRAFTLSPGTGTAAVGVLVLGVGAFVLLAWRRGRDRRFVGSPVDQVMGNPDGRDQAVPLLEGDASAPVEFAPPDELRPGQVGTLVDERANTLDVTATIVDLAGRGFLMIRELPKEGWFAKPDWEFVRLEKPQQELLPYERTLLDGLFRDGNEATLSSLRTTFAERLQKVVDELYRDSVQRGWFRDRPDKVRTRWVAIGVGALVLASGLTFVLARWTRFGLVGIAAVIVGIVFLAGASRMPSRTAKGTAMLRRIRGFRTVIEKADTHLSRWAEQEHVFTRFLPYAIVFGVTEKWAEAFERLGAPAQDTSWYVSSRPFVYADFGRALDGFTVAASGTIASTPSGSGSSGFSGGSSGGGGGGGGGGSW
jgi:uncharacterized protein (TIGR04222 family)